MRCVKLLCHHGTYLTILLFFIRPRCCTEQAASKYKRSEWSAASHSAVPGEAVVAWQEIEATMEEMHDDREHRNAQQKYYVCFSEGSGIC